MTSSEHPTRATLHFSLNFFTARQGGLVKAVLSRADALAETGAFDRIWIEVLRWEDDLAAAVKQRKKQGRLHPSVKVRSVLHVRDRSPAKAAGLSVSDMWHRDVDPREVRAVETRSGRVVRLEHLSPTGTVLRRDDFNGRGKFVRSRDLDPESGKVCTERWMGRNGQPFLSVEVDPQTSKWLSADVTAHDPRHFGNTRDLYRRAFDEAIASEALPIVFSEFRDHLTVLPTSSVDEVVAGLEHPNLRTVAAIHSNHRLPPFVSGAPVHPFGARCWTTPTTGMRPSSGLPSSVARFSPSSGRTHASTSSPRPRAPPASRNRPTMTGASFWCRASTRRSGSTKRFVSSRR